MTMDDTAAETHPPDSVTRHHFEVGDESFDYLATAGTLDVGSQAGHRARIFFVAYIREDATKSDTRSLTFAYNGGPGAASAYLHMGAWGPKRVEVDNPTATPPAPYTLIDNRHSLLPSTDLVFIDPVGTGYSHVLGDTPEDAFFGVETDLESIGEFIRKFLSLHGRWNSPKFLAGESYGTTRSALLVDQLQSDFSVDFNGVILVSSILNFETMDFGAGNDLPYPFYLPTYAATAWFHDVLGLESKPDDFPNFMADVREFARTEYAAALMEGDQLNAGERDRVIKRFAEFTGLSQTYLRAANLRVEADRFRKQVLRARGEVVGRYDSRYSGPDVDATLSSAEYDPTDSAIDGAYTAAINTHLHRDLGYGRGQQYVVLNDQAIYQWEWMPNVPGYDKAYYIDVSQNLRRAMIRNPHLKVFFAKGYYDLATPFFATEYTIAHLNLPHRLRANITLRHYSAGHMIYLRDQEQTELNDDLHAFMQRAMERGQ